MLQKKALCVTKNISDISKERCIYADSLVDLKFALKEVAHNLFALKKFYLNCKWILLGVNLIALLNSLIIIEFNTFPSPYKKLQEKP